MKLYSVAFEAVVENYLGSKKTINYKNPVVVLATDEEAAKKVVIDNSHELAMTTKSCVKSVTILSVEEKGAILLTAGLLSTV